MASNANVFLNRAQAEYFAGVLSQFNHVKVTVDVASTSAAVARINAGNYQTNGYTAAVTQNVGDRFSATMMYGSGGVLTAERNTIESDSPDDLRKMIRASRRHAVTARISGVTPRTGTTKILVDRLDQGMTLPQAIADPRASQRNAVNTSPEQAFLDSPLRKQLEDRGHHFGAPAEIGAATGIEFLPDGRVLAAAEPVRRGGGSALVERPSP